MNQDRVHGWFLQICICIESLVVSIATCMGAGSLGLCQKTMLVFLGEGKGGWLRRLALKFSLNPRHGNLDSKGVG